MENFGGSKAFQYFSIVFILFFFLHVLIQWILTRIFGPFGKKSTHEPVTVGSSDDDLNGINQNTK